MSGYTKGPWKVVALDWAENGNPRFEIEGIGATGMADARLIAASPDLLEALRAVLADLPELWGDQVIGGRIILSVDADAIDVALKAMSAATGKIA